MFITASDIAPGEVRHLFCSDRRLRQEVARNHRLRHRLSGNGSLEPYVDPVSGVAFKEEETCPGQ
jgi:hypothetical protein